MKQNQTPLSRQISHMISPQYVWVQLEDDWRQLETIQQKLNSPSYRLTPVPSHYSDSYITVRLSQSGFTFRAKILEGMNRQILLFVL